MALSRPLNWDSKLVFFKVLKLQDPTLLLLPYYGYSLLHCLNLLHCLALSLSLSLSLSNDILVLTRSYVLYPTYPSFFDSFSNRISSFPLSYYTLPNSRNLVEDLINFYCVYLVWETGRMYSPFLYILDLSTISVQLMAINRA